MKFQVQLGWNNNLDLDLMAAGLHKDKCKPDWLIYYNNLKSPNDAIVLNQDNIKGNDLNEIIIIDTDLLPLDIENIVILTTTKSETFGKAIDSYIRLYKDDEFIYEFLLDIEFNTSSTLHFINLNKVNNNWEVEIVGIGTNKQILDYIKEIQ